MVSEGQDFQKRTGHWSRKSRLEWRCSRFLHRASSPQLSIEREHSLFSRLKQTLIFKDHSTHQGRRREKPHLNDLIHPKIPIFQLQSNQKSDARLKV